MRALAACAVAVFHARQSAPGWEEAGAYIGAAGVDLFFVISGFIMASVAQGRRPGAFLADRAWRIYPLWIIAVLPWILVLGASPEKLAASVTLWPIYGNAFVVPVLTVGWTLSFELLFYAAIAIGLATRPLVPVACFAAFLVLGLNTDSALFDFLGSPMIIEFLLGMCLAKVRRDLRIALPLAAIAIGVIVSQPVEMHGPDMTFVPEQALQRALMWGVPSAALLYAALCLESRVRSEAFDFGVLLGDASFSIYLFHRLVYVLLEANWLIELAAAIIVGIAAYRYIEKPLMEMRRRRPLQVRSAQPRQAIASDASLH